MKLNRVANQIVACCFVITVLKLVFKIEKGARNIKEVGAATQKVKITEATDVKQTQNQRASANSSPRSTVVRHTLSYRETVKHVIPQNCRSSLVSGISLHGLVMSNLLHAQHSHRLFSQFCPIVKAFITSISSQIDSCFRLFGMIDANIEYSLNCLERKLLLIFAQKAQMYGRFLCQSRSQIGSQIGIRDMLLICPCSMHVAPPPPYDLKILSSSLVHILSYAVVTGGSVEEPRKIVGVKHIL